jgi:hypothetical protein
VGFEALTTTDAQYQRALAQLRKRPDPPGHMLDWVCRDNLSYLDLTQNRLEMDPDLMRSPTSPIYLQSTGVATLARPP